MQKFISESDLARFWAKVRKTDSCWLWTASVQPTGYGQFQINRTVVYAHRLSWEIAYGPIGAGLDIDHRCRTRICVNPGHLRSATRKQNMENRSGAQKDSATGILGVSWDRERKRWKAQVAHNRKKLTVGRFDRIEDAEAAVKAKRNDLFTHNDLDRTM